MLCRLTIFFLVVFVQEQTQAVVVHHVVLRERERPPHEASQPLSQNIVEPLRALVG